MVLIHQYGLEELKTKDIYLRSRQQRRVLGIHAIVLVRPTPTSFDPLSPGDTYILHKKPIVFSTPGLQGLSVVFVKSSFAWPHSIVKARILSSNKCKNNEFHINR